MPISNKDYYYNSEWRTLLNISQQELKEYDRFDRSYNSKLRFKNLRPTSVTEDGVLWNFISLDMAEVPTSIISTRPFLFQAEIPHLYEDFLAQR